MNQQGKTEPQSKGGKKRKSLGYGGRVYMGGWVELRQGQGLGWGRTWVGGGAGLLLRTCAERERQHVESRASGV